MQKSMVTFNFSIFFTGITSFGQSWSKKSNLSVYAEIWYLDLYDYAEFNGSIHQNIKIVSLSWHLIPMLISVLDGKPPFWANLVQNIKIVSLSSSNVVPTIIEMIFESGSSFHVEWRTAGGVYFLFSRVFCYYWRSFGLAGGAGRWAMILWGLSTFLIFRNLLGS